MLRMPRAALGADPEPDPARPDHGRQPPRLPRVEGAPLCNALSRTRASRSSCSGRTAAAVNLIKELARSPQWRVVGSLRRRRGQDRPPAARRQRARAPRRTSRAGSERLGVAQAIIAMPEATHAARRRALEHLHAGGAQGADRALVRRPRERPGHGIAGAPRRARRPARARPGDARRRRPARLAERPGGHGHRRRRLDRRGAVPADRALRAAPAGACSS